MHIAMAVGSMEPPRFFIVHVLIDFLRHSQQEVDMIENLDSIGCLSCWQEILILFPHPCLQLLVSLRPDVFCASVHCCEEEILKEAGIEVAGIIVYIAWKGNCIHLLCDVIHGEITKE